jgi:phosphotriesterase-related protein
VLAVEGRVQTVLGDTPAAELGATLIHEHLICDLSTYWRPLENPSVAGLSVSFDTLRTVRLNPSAVRHNFQLDQIDVAIAELEPFRASGGASLVEVTSHGIGRDVKALEYIARASQINVIAGCGYYIGSSRPPGFASRAEADLTTELVEELTTGIRGTGVRAGVIGEIGVGQFPMLDHERRMLIAAVRAQQEISAGMIVHPAPGTDSTFEIVETLDRVGASMEKVVIAHLDERFRSSLKLFQRIASSGVRFGFDTFGREAYLPSRQKQHPSDSERIEAVLALWDAGLGERITLAQDVCHRIELAAFGGQGYSYVLDTIIPRMRQRGITDTMIDQMLIRTPALVLALPGEANNVRPPL